MINLAFWQLRRLHERRATNSQITEHVAQAAVPVGDLLTPTTTPAEVAGAAWRSVTASGSYDPANEVLIRNRSLDSNAGYHVVTPLRLGDGAAVLVNRGWVPLEQQAGHPPSVPRAPTGVVTVTGRIRVSQHKGRYFSPSDPAQGHLDQLYRVDVPRIGRQVPYPLLPAYLELQSTQPAPAGARPVPIALPGLDEGPHLSYAIQWFFFSGCAIVGWILAIRRSAKRRDQSAAHAEPPDGHPARTEEPDARAHPSALGRSDPGLSAPTRPSGGTARRHPVSDGTGPEPGRPPRR
jgi:cytochrome oxidase assembly protein ShyY1